MYVEVYPKMELGQVLLLDPSFIRALHTFYVGSLGKFVKGMMLTKSGIPSCR